MENEAGNDFTRSIRFAALFFCVLRVLYGQFLVVFLGLEPTEFNRKERKELKEVDS